MGCHKYKAMNFNPDTRGPRARRDGRKWRWAVTLPACLLFALAVAPARGQGNLLKNPGFEETPREGGAPPGWERTGPGAARITVTDKEAQAGRQCAAVPAGSAVGQRIGNAEAGAYVLRCWVKSESDQPVTLLLQDPDRPWEAYACAEVPAPKEQWTQLQAFCVLDQKGSLTVTVGGTSKEFNLYHGVSGQMSSPILLDTCELIRYRPTASAPVAVWDTKKDLSALPDWSAKGRWTSVSRQSWSFRGAPVFQARQLAGTVRSSDGGLVIGALEGQALKTRAVLVPSPAFTGCKCALVHARRPHWH